MNIYIQKLARIRDEGDSLSNLLLKLAEQEAIDKSFRQGLIVFGESFAAIQDYRDAQVGYLTVSFRNFILNFMKGPKT